MTARLAHALPTSVRTAGSVHVDILLWKHYYCVFLIVLCVFLLLFYQIRKNQTSLDKFLLKRPASEESASKKLKFNEVRGMSFLKS